MAFSIIYWIFVVASLALGWRFADRSGRDLIVAIGAAAVGSFLAYGFLARAVASQIVNAIDVVLLVIAIHVALKSLRFWPLWFAGFQGAAIISKVAAPWAAAADQSLFLVLSAFWVVPCQIVAALGPLLDARSNLATKSCPG